MFTPLTDLINNIVNDAHWPIELGCANITPGYKKMSTTNKENYRPLSVVHQSLRFLRDFFAMSFYCSRKINFLLYHAVLRKNYSTQHALIRLIK